MNGSDLESDFGLATADLAQMLDSGLCSDNANVLILTGGANRWMNSAIPETECIIWEMADGWLNEVESLGKVNMGNPATLRDFIVLSMEQYPAEKFGLIMWDHGGGSIAGFGHDEKFNNSSLSLLEMKQAFEDAGLREQKLEFLGFDACLMATIEMAILASDYAHVLIASEDLEPGEGWDYNFLSVLNETPCMDGFALGKVIVDKFIDFFGEDSDDILTLSVVDLARVEPVMEAMGRLMENASQELQANPTMAAGRRIRGFNALAERRARTKTFGEGSPRDNYADMVDIGDMAIELSDFFPREARAVLEALENCVVYNRHNSDVDLWGLSTFYIYGGKSIGVPSLETYAALGMDESYTQYLHKFFQGLERRTDGFAPIIRRELALWQPVSKNRHRMVGLLQTDKAKCERSELQLLSTKYLCLPQRGLCPTEVNPKEVGRAKRGFAVRCKTSERNEIKAEYLWPKINGHPVVLYPIATTANARKYAIPAEINGHDADIIVSFSGAYPQGQIQGSRERIENVFPKGCDPILPGDKIAVYYQEYNFATHSETWVKGEMFTAGDYLHLTWEQAAPGCKPGYRTTDAAGKIDYE